LLGMMLAGIPLEDRELKSSSTGRHSTLSRVAWYAFPLVTLILVMITFVLVTTPMEKKVAVSDLPTANETGSLLVPRASFDDIGRHTHRDTS
jgi:hypothetical protein